jgi:tetraacyldisaccharide 4'-kinase
MLRQAVEPWLFRVWYGRSVFKYLLWPLAALFAVAVGIRRWLYRSGIFRIHRAAVPVIVIGNLTVGGTGKTPLVIWLAEQLGRIGLRVGLVCRGYGGRASEWPQQVGENSNPATVGDEAVLLSRATACPVVAGPDRVACVKLLGRSVDVILSDDGLQHYALARDLELAVVDGRRGLGNGFCLPAGPLREPPSRLGDVDAIIVNGGDWGHGKALRMRMRLTHLTELSSGRHSALADFHGRRVHAVAGIGHPERFFADLTAAGISVDPRPLADHAEIEQDNLDFDDGCPVLVTEKDAVKCTGLDTQGVWSVAAVVDFDSGDDERLLSLLTRRLEQGRH